MSRGMFRHARRACLCLAIVLSLRNIPGALGAQSSPAGNGVLEGVVRDSVSGSPMQKSLVCAELPRGPSWVTSRCGRTDSTGTYRVDSIPSGRRRVSVLCETVRGLGSKHLASDSVALDEGASVRRDWLVPSIGCDPRPIRRMTGFFRGHYTPGFEASEFVPCAADGWFVPGDSLDWYSFNNRRAWVEWAPGFNQRLEWPRAPRDAYGNSRFYVRWRGTVVGPGRYGHMGVSAFEIRVDSVAELRAPNKRDCR